MNLFTRLNKETGISIIMVTHEPDVAEFTDRKVLFKDGEIIDDSPVKHKKPSKKKNSIPNIINSISMKMLLFFHLL